MVRISVDILLDSTFSTEILSWKKFIKRVESSKIQKWQSLDSPKFLWLYFEQIPSTRQVFLNHFWFAQIWNSVKWINQSGNKLRAHSSFLISKAWMNYLSGCEAVGEGGLQK